MIRFTLFRVPVHIHLSFWVAALVWWLVLTAGEPHFMGVLFFAVAAFACFLAHELGHALVGGRALGATLGICLSWQGSGCCCEQEASCSRWAGVCISMAGPLAGLLVAVAVYAALWALTGSAAAGWTVALRMLQGQVPMELAGACPPLLLLMMVYMLQISIFWSTLNLLPIYPLDGGTMIHELMGENHLIHSISMALTCGLSLFFFAAGVWALAVLMALLAYYNYRCILVHTE